MKYKKWSLAEKLEILASCDEIGTVESCRKYSVSNGTLYSYKKKEQSTQVKQWHNYTIQIQCQKICYKHTNN